MVEWAVMVWSGGVWAGGFGGLGGRVVVASIALGYASYVLVETPFRKPRQILDRSRLFEASVASLIVLAGFGLAVSSTDGFPARFPEPVRQILAYGHNDRSDLYRYRTCFLTTMQSWRDLKPQCLPGGRPSALVWGDSNAAHLYQALQGPFPQFVVIPTNMAHCAPYIC